MRITFQRTLGDGTELEPPVRYLIETHSLKRICEVGAGRKPLLSDDYIREHGLDCTLLDASEHELSQALTSCTRVVADVGQLGRFHLIYSRSVAEHIRRGCDFHRSIHGLLVDGGYACHHFPTLYALPFVMNILIPDEVATVLKSFLIHGKPRSEYTKFPAFYSWCRGPTRRQIERLTNAGFEVLEYTGYFGHEHYYRHLGPVRKIHRALVRFSLQHPSPHLTSFAMVTLRKAC
jgi:uncharacterized UPF0146 family protein